jgi:hypothetical protein
MHWHAVEAGLAEVVHLQGRDLPDQVCEAHTIVIHRLLYVSQVEIIPVPAPFASEKRRLHHEIEEKIRRIKIELAEAKPFSSDSSASIERLYKKLKILLDERRQTRQG